MGWYKKLKGLAPSRHVTVKVVNKAVVQQPISKPIKYVLSDPSTPTLIKEVTAPAIPPAPRFTVMGYRGGGYAPTTVAGQAANVYVTVANCINGINRMSDKKLTSWAGTRSLNIIPRAGRRLNASYDRRSLAFFYYKDVEKNKDMFTSDSADIVAHELGHAVLDSFRPDLWSVASLEVWAFHEAFGDFTAMMSVMQHDEILKFVYDQTGGDVRRYNLISGIAEDFGRVVSQYRPTQNRNWLRNAINEFKYVLPTSLPQNGSDETLTSNPHSFSKVMLGTLYDLWAAFYNQYRIEGVEPIQAMKNARNLVGKYTLSAIQKTPVTSRFYNWMAKTMMNIDKEAGSVWLDIMGEVFAERSIIQASALSFDGDEHHHENTKCCRRRLCECLPHSLLGDNNPLYDVKVELPNDSKESLLAAKKMLDYLHMTDSVSEAEDAPFELSDGKLVRSFFMCSDC